MPDTGIFDALLERRQGCDKYPDPVANYDASVQLSALIDHAEPGTITGEQELYDYVWHVLAKIDADTTLTVAQKGEIAGHLLASLTFNTCFDEQIVWRASDDYEAAKQQAAGHDQAGIRLFGLAVKAEVRTTGTFQWPK